MDHESVKKGVVERPMHRNQHHEKEVLRNPIQHCKKTPWVNDRLGVGMESDRNMREIIPITLYNGENDVSNEHMAFDHS